MKVRKFKITNTQNPSDLTKASSDILSFLKNKYGTSEFILDSNAFKEISESTKLTFNTVKQRCTTLKKVNAIAYLESFERKVKKFSKTYPTLIHGTKEYAKAAYIKSLYGLSVDQFDEMKKKGSKCQICNNRPGTHIDHCHTSLKVRGLLCFKFNSALGLLEDNILLFENAIKYLKNNG